MVLDRYLHRESPIHTLDARVKLLGTIAAIINNNLLPDGAWLGFAASWVLTLILSQRAGLGAFFAFKRSFIAVPFLLAGLSVVFVTPGNPIADVPWFGRVLTITDAGVVRLLSLMLRTWLSVQMAILLTATTTFPDLTHALRHLKVPAVLVSIIALMYRYLFVLVEEAQRLLRARSARSAAVEGVKSGGSIAWRGKVAGGMAGQLFVRSLERADRVYNAMAARGYRGHMMTMTPHLMLRRDWAAAGILAIALVLIQAIARWFYF